MTDRDTSGENPRFDHLLHWVPDVEATVAAYRAAGLPAHVNPELDGFRNGGWRQDERYVEILTVTDRERLRTSRYAEGLALLAPAIAALPGPGGPITFAVDVVDARATAARLRRDGHEVREFAVTLAEHGVSFVEVFVLDGPAWWPFFITYSPPRDELLAGVDPSTFERGAHDLAGLVVQVPDPVAAAASLADLLGLPADGTRIPLPGGAVVFEAGSPEGIVATTLTTDTTRAAVELDGLHVRFGA